jgi:hypothetical protein
MSKDDAFEKSRKGANSLYNDTLIELIRKTKSLQANEFSIIFLDKNHPANGGIENAV